MNPSTALTALRRDAPRLPSFLIRALRASLFRTIGTLRTGQLLVMDPDGRESQIGAKGTRCYRVRINDPAFYAYAAFGGSTGIGQAWSLGLWETNDLVDVARLFVREREALGAVDGGLARLRLPVYRLMEWRRRNTLKGSRRNIAAHYDLGNDFFKLFLDDSMTYSSGVFVNDANSLASAQEHKYDLICRKLDLKPGQWVLEIGGGWGGFALHAARRYGVHITTTTISQEQFDLARKRIADAGLSAQIKVHKSDYRGLRGQYDKLVSIEMIEAVGHDFLPDYFRQVDRLLKPDGEALIQAITIQNQYYEELRQSTDFIRECIFPGGHLPSVQEMLRVTASCTSLRLFHLDDFGQDYARTLHLWREAFLRHQSQVTALGYASEFRRMWDFYLASCEAGFLEATTSVVHAHFTKPACLREHKDFRRFG